MVERFARRIPEPTVVRLPIYQRALLELSAGGTTTVSSAELADAAGVNAAKVRKDLSHLGTYGTPGTGYDVNYLLGQVRRELGLDREWRVVIVGMGNLGHALAHSQRFSTQNFRTVALFDVDPSKVGGDVDGMPIRHLSELAELPTIVDPSHAIGVIACPASAAQDVCNRLVQAGVGAILNFAPTVLNVSPTVLLRQVDFAVELQALAFYVVHPEAVAASEESSSQSCDKRQALTRLRIATRGSELALAQTDLVAAGIKALDQTGSLTVEIVVVETAGDRQLDRPIGAIGGQGVFVKEVERAVLDRRADIAVHSAKDLPSITGSDELQIAAVPRRGDPRDALVGRPLSELGPGAHVATGAPRRRAQLSWLRPDLRFEELRGNIATRLARFPRRGRSSWPTRRSSVLGWGVLQRRCSRFRR